MRSITEERAEWTVPAVRHQGWREGFSWLVQGVTARGAAERPFDLGLFGAGGGGEATWDRWAALAREAGFARVVHGAQLHGVSVRVHASGAPGLHVCWDADAHVTRSPDVLLAVSVADCVPVFLVHPGARAVALVHAGWRGVAGGVLERTLETLSVRLDVSARDLHLHLGPAICGRCYEVGPEVHEALGLDRPESPGPVDLRSILAERGIRAGVAEEAISLSNHCTRCGPGDFFSHRGGDPERQIAFVGIRAGGGAG